MARTWDAANLLGEDVVYRANIMHVRRLHDTEGQDVEVPDEWRQLAERFTINPPHRHYSGYVGLLNNHYTTTTETRDPSADERCEPIAFPFTCPDENRRGDHPFLPNILGAPQAAATNKPSYVHDVADILKAYRSGEGNVNGDVSREIKDYYSDTSLAQSILSIPVLSSGDYMCVVNIYRNQVGMLFSGQKVRDYVNIVAPNLELLMRILPELELMEQKLDEVL